MPDLEFININFNTHYERSRRRGTGVLLHGLRKAARELGVKTGKRSAVEAGAVRSKKRARKTSRLLSCLAEVDRLVGTDGDTYGGNGFRDETAGEIDMVKRSGERRQERRGNRMLVCE
jgi:hypothetical protein